MLKSCLWLLAFTSVMLATGLAQARAEETVNIAFAGSMGAVMDKGFGPVFQAKSGVQYQGIGQASLGLAHLLASKSLNADVFVPVSAVPVKIVEAAGLADGAVPVASTQMVLAYAPKSKFAPAFAAAKGGDWTKILQEPGLRFGRTDPDTDPQGQYALYALQLAGLYYKQPGLADKISGIQENTAQIFAEPSLLARLQDGQIDATIGYESAVISQHLPFVKLPAEVDFSDPSLMKDWYGKASLIITSKGETKTVHPAPLVFYAAVLKNAANPQAAKDFVDFLLSADGQAIFAKYGYNPGKGPKL